MILIPLKKAKDPAIAKRMLEYRDYRISRGWKVDKITEKFVGDHLGSWRQLWIVHADGGGLDRYLDAAIEEYCCACLNDSFNESPHAEMNTIVKKKSRSRPGLWFALHRFGEAMKFKRRLDKTRPGQFSRYFKGWKHVFTPHVKIKENRLFPRKLAGFANLQARTVIRKAYRLNEFAIMDSQGSGLEDTQRQFLNLHSSQGAVNTKAINPENLLKKEYLKSVLKEGIVFCISTTPHGQEAIAHPEPEPDQSLALALLPSDIVLFEVVDCKAAQKSYVVDIADEDQPMVLPMVIRQLTVHKSHEQSSNFAGFSGAKQEHFLFSVGPAAMEDVMEFIPMYHMKKSLVRWCCSRASSVNGCMRIFSPFNCASIQWH